MREEVNVVEERMGMDVKEDGSEVEALDGITWFSRGLGGSY